MQDVGLMFAVPNTLFETSQLLSPMAIAIQLARSASFQVSAIRTRAHLGLTL